MTGGTVPGELEELQELFDREAHNYNVYSLVDGLINAPSGKDTPSRMPGRTGA